MGGSQNPCACKRDSREGVDEPAKASTDAAHEPARRPSVCGEAQQLRIAVETERSRSFGHLESSATVRSSWNSVFVCEAAEEGVGRGLLGGEVGAAGAGSCDYGWGDCAKEKVGDEGRVEAGVDVADQDA